MKWKILLILVLLVWFLPSVFSSTESVIFNLAMGSQSYNTTQEKNDIFKKQMKPIIETFNLDITDLELAGIKCYLDLEECSPEIIKGDYGGTTLQTKMEISFLEKSAAQFDYSTIRNGTELNKRDDFAQVGDKIRFKPPIEVEDGGHDWIARGGGVYDTPPIEFIEDWGIYSKLKKKFKSRYPCGAPFLYSPWQICEGEIPEFSTKKTTFNENINQYTGEFGHPVYVIPIKGNKKAGIQIFCKVSGSEPLAVTKKKRFEVMSTEETAECEEKDKGVIECTLKKEGETTISGYMNIRCMAFIDKIIKNGEAIQADWFQKTMFEDPGKQQSDDVLKVRFKKKFRVLPKGKKAPVPKINYKIIKENGEKYIEYDASQSYDPGGTITKYLWSGQFGGGAWGQKQKKQFKQKVNKEGQFTITLKVTDNDGIENTTKIIINTQPKPITKFTAIYNPTTKKAELTPICAKNESVLIDIDQFNEDVKPILSVIEKQAIKCNQTTSIGPITPQQKPATYQTTAILDETKETAAFTINQ